MKKWIARGILAVVFSAAVWRLDSAIEGNWLEFTIALGIIFFVFGMVGWAAIHSVSGE